MIHAVIIDDEAYNITNLSELLQQYAPDVKVTGTAANAEDGLKLIYTVEPDLVFLDIQMPGGSGFDMLKKLPRLNFELIFVTAFDQYGIQAIKFAAIDYLLKPVSIHEFSQAVSRAGERIREKKKNGQLENLLSFLHHQQNREEHRIALPSAKETRFVPPAQIVRCESSNNYTTFYLQSGESILVAKPLFEYETLLQDYGFARTHQSHLVNKRYVRSLVKEDGGYLLLDNGAQIPVARQKKEFIKKWLG